MNLKFISKILNNENAVKLIEFLIAHETEIFSLTEISEYLFIHQSYVSKLLEILRNFVVRTYRKNYRNEKGIICVPKLKNSFKIFFEKFKQQVKELENVK